MVTGGGRKIGSSSGLGLVFCRQAFFSPPSGCLRARKSHDEEKNDEIIIILDSFFTHFMHQR